MEKIVKQSVKILVFLMTVFFISFITASVSLSSASKPVSCEETFRSFYKTTPDTPWQQGDQVSADKIKWQGDKQNAYFPVWVTEEIAKEDSSVYPHQLIILQKFFNTNLDDLENSAEVELPEMFRGISMKLSEIKDSVTQFSKLKQQHDQKAKQHYEELFTEELDILKGLKVQLTEDYAKIYHYLQTYKRETQTIVNFTQTVRSLDVESLPNTSETFSGIAKELSKLPKVATKYYDKVNEKLDLVTKLISYLKKSNPAQLEIQVNKPRKAHSISQVHQLLIDLQAPKLRLEKALHAVKEVEKRLPELALKGRDEEPVTIDESQTGLKVHSEESSDDESDGIERF